MFVSHRGNLNGPNKDVENQAKTNCFFHESDLVVLTGHGYKWYHSDSIDMNIEYDSKSVVAIPNQQYKIKDINICSDYLL